MRASAACTARGAKRAIALPVSAPFHSSLMEPARRKMKPLLDAAVFADPKWPIVTNADAAAESSGARLRDALVRQIDSPVRWVASMQLLVREGVDSGLEIGPGNVLTGLARRIDRSLKVAAYGG